jgi:hypothetical protein
LTPNEQAGFAGIGVASSLFAGIGQYEAGQEQKAAYNYNADITLQNMQAQMIASQQKYSELVGRQASAYARAGVDVASGSPLLVMAATAARGAQEGEEIKQAGTEEANLQRYYGKIAAWQGEMGGIGSFLTGMTKSLQPFMQVNPSVKWSQANPETAMG